MTQTEHRSNAERIRSQLKHPVIDSDAHVTEFGPLFTEAFIDAVGRIAGSELRDELAAARSLRRYLVERTTPVGQAFGSQSRVYPSAEERKASNIPIPAWAPPHSHPLDLATAIVP